MYANITLWIDWCLSVRSTAWILWSMFFQVEYAAYPDILCPTSTIDGIPLVASDAPSQQRSGVSLTSCALGCFTSSCMEINYNKSSSTCSTYDNPPKRYVTATNSMNYQVHTSYIIYFFSYGHAIRYESSRRTRVYGMRTFLLGYNNIQIDTIVQKNIILMRIINISFT